MSIGAKAELKGRQNMKRRVFAQAFLLGLFCDRAFAADPLPTLRETPMFADQVKSGALPPIGERIPTLPWVVKEFAGGDGPGRQGGQLNMLVANARDTSLMTVYSYTRFRTGGGGSLILL